MDGKGLARALSDVDPGILTAAQRAPQVVLVLVSVLELYATHDDQSES